MSRLKLKLQRHKLIERQRADARRYDVLCHCRFCGWEFTIHTTAGIIYSDGYSPTAEWFCPHCGQVAEEKGRHGK